MKRRVAVGALLVVFALSAVGYVTWRRDEQYRAYLAFGEDAVRSGDSFGAIENFSGAIALRPSSMVARLKRGEVYLERGDYRSALRDLRQAVALDPAAPRPLELLGDTHAALQRPHRAADHYEAYLKLDDRAPRVLYKLALVRLEEGETDVAIQALSQAARLDDRAASVQYLLGVSLAQQQRWPDSVRALERAVALAPAMTEAREALADGYRNLGRRADQIRQLEALTALDPNRPGRHIAVAEAWARGGRFDLAVTTIARAMERFPGDADLLVTLGRIWLSVAEGGRDRVALSKALEALRRAVARSPSAPALSLLGRAQLTAGDTRAAFRSLSQATASLPVDPRALADLATAAERLGRWAVARDALTREAALRGDADPPRARAERSARLAGLCQRLGDRPAAIDWLERAVAAAPEDRALSARLAALRAG